MGGQLNRWGSQFLLQKVISSLVLWCGLVKLVVLMLMSVWSQATLSLAMWLAHDLRLARLARHLPK